MNEEGSVEVEPLEVRAIRPDEWRLLRSIRLEALENSPEAYITTYEEASAFPDGLWSDRAQKGSAGDSQLTVLAIDGRVAVGLAVGLWDPDRSGDVMPVVSVYVSSGVRGRGVGTQVMEVVHDWGRSKGASASSLWVVDDNVGARSFYERLGYRATLDRHCITVPPIRWETRMILDLR